MDINRLPIVGQIMEVHTGDITAVVTCKCDLRNKPFLIPSVNSQVVCIGCKGVYRIVGAMFDAQKQLGVQVAVAQIGKLTEREEQPVTVN